MNDALELFRAWAPDGSMWSPWVKPVLFAADAGVLPKGFDAWREERNRPRAWKPPRPLDAALVLDVAGPRALALALDAAAQGWRPVPLFNSCCGPAALLDNEPLRAGLEDGADELRALALRHDALPAFVLDARRLDGVPAPSRFDNRWIVFPQDFPSGALLRSSGIRQVLLVQSGRSEPRNDLAHVLLRWQEAGLAIHTLDIDSTEPEGVIQVKKPGLFRALGYRVFAAVGLRPSSAGGFGAVVPLMTSGGGWS